MENFEVKYKPKVFLIFLITADYPIHYLLLTNIWLKREF